MSVFKFKYFTISQEGVSQKVGTDAMVLGALVTYDSPKRILDIGTGSGVIALMLAQQFPAAEITGIDIDLPSVELAQFNFNAAAFPNSFKAIKSDFLQFTPPHSFDLIVSNPPYFNTQMFPSNQQRSIARHESKMSLQAMMQHAAKMLTPQGELWFIVPAERTEELIEEKGELSLIKRIMIYGKPQRHVRDVLVFSTKKTASINTPESLVIRDEENSYTAQYIALTKEFHFNPL